MSTKDFLEKDYYKALGVAKTAKPAERRLQRVGDRLEASGQLPVLPRLVNGVEHGQ